MNQRLESGQSLIELVVALGVGVAMLGVASGGLFVVLRSSQLSQQYETASALVTALTDNAAALGEKKWHNLYDLNKGSASHYFVATSTGQLAVQGGDQQTDINSTAYTVYFYVDNVSRDVSGNIESIYNQANDDPSTQKITAIASWNISGSSPNVASVAYLTRWPNEVFRQSDWSGGAGQEGPITAANSQFISQTNVDFTSQPGSIKPAVSGCDGDTENCELISSVFDTGVAGGVAPNTIMWQGVQTSGKVRFKISSSNSVTGPWSWAGQPLKPPGPNIQMLIDKSQHNNKRYLRYKIILESSATTSPKVDDLIINWSR